jgi:hypothetical protein
VIPIYIVGFAQLGGTDDLSGDIVPAVQHV